jgi:hypothetical protein
MNPWATNVILPAILNQIKTAGKWQVKTGSLEVLQQLIVSAPAQVATAMPDLVPVLAEAVWDTKSEVKKMAKATLTKACALVDNKDVSTQTSTWLTVDREVHPGSYQVRPQPYRGGPQDHHSPFSHHVRCRGYCPYDLFDRSSFD